MVTPVRATVLVTHQGGMAHSHSGDVGDGVVRPRCQIADLDTEVPESSSHQRAGTLPSLDYRPAAMGPLSRSCR